MQMYFSRGTTAIWGGQRSTLAHSMSVVDILTAIWGSSYRGIGQ